jgi:hypothetical protein
MVICDSAKVDLGVFGKVLTELTNQISPTAFSNQIHLNREKVKIKTKKMMGWIEK